MTRDAGSEVEFLVLEYLDQATGPIGCGQLADYLRQRGHMISEATVGRLLRDLDLKELTARAGFRGRSLTQSGTTRLEDLRRRRTLEAYSTELVDALHFHRIEELVEVLVARRAIEREATRLAAIEATPQDVADLADLVEQHEKADDARVLAYIDMAFHRRLAEISRNRVLQAVTQLVHQEAELVPIPDAVAVNMQQMLAGDHRKVLEAIQAGSPEAAEQAMMQHIDSIIRVVKDQGDSH